MRNVVFPFFLILIYWGHSQISFTQDLTSFIEDDFNTLEQVKKTVEQALSNPEIGNDLPALQNELQQNRFQLDALHAAVIVGNKDLFNKAIASHNTTDPIDANGKTPLLYAIEMEHFDMAKDLAEAGADVNFTTSLGTSPLILAIYKKNEELVEFLTSFQADVNFISNGVSIYDWAKFNKLKNAIQILKEKGAEKNGLYSPALFPQSVKTNLPVSGYHLDMKIGVAGKPEIEKCLLWKRDYHGNVYYEIELLVRVMGGQKQRHFLTFKRIGDKLLPYSFDGSANAHAKPTKLGNTLIQQNKISLQEDVVFTQHSMGTYEYIIFKGSEITF